MDSDGNTVDDLPNVCRLSLTPNRGEYPKSCALCPSVLLCTDADLVTHLRIEHCSKEGGSFVCRFGANGVCQSLPLEGVSDEDYEQHVRRFHLDMEDISAALNACRPRFTVNSYTQNLSSVIADPRRSKSETTTFFTRHWGEQFVPKTSVSAAPSLPRISSDHFRQYLSTTAKKHRQYLKAKRALRKALARHAEENAVDPDEVPSVFTSATFALNKPETFEAVFLEPPPGEQDKLMSDSERRRASTASPQGTCASLSRPDSCTSLVSTPSLNAQLPIEAANRRWFRPYHALHNRLEYYHDTVGTLLNHQLETKGETFWKTVNSYGALQMELVDAKRKTQTVRGNLRVLDEKFYERSQKIIRLQRARENRERLLHRLQDIACLRDAQTTVQMLLNQNDFPKALECIETAEEVLNSDLKGVTCFRHLSSQLQELHKFIGRMLNEEFITLIQKEFGKPIEKESECSYQEGQLPAVVLGVLRCREYKFLQVIKNEVVEAIKNSIRQKVRARIIECGTSMADLDPSLVNLSDKMRKMTYAEWTTTMDFVFNSLFLFCRRVLSIQELILENVERAEAISRAASPQADATAHITSSASCRSFQHMKSPEDNHANGEIPRCNSAAVIGKLELRQKQSNATGLAEHAGSPPPANDEDSDGEELPSGGRQPTAASNMASVLAMPCHSLAELKENVTLLLPYTVYSCEERACKLLVARSKDAFLETCTPECYGEVEKVVHKFVDRSRELVESVDEKRAAQLKSSRSPLLNAMQQQRSKFISRFHENKRQKLGNIIDSEQWRPAEVPRLFQKIIDVYSETGVFADNVLDEGEEADGGIAPKDTAPAECLLVDDERFVVVGTSLLLLRMLAQYCSLLALFPQCASELLLNTVEILKNFNSRTCQLILGAGALQLIGLKTISVKHMALAGRCLQLIARFIPVVRTNFAAKLPEKSHQQLRHFDTTLRDYNDHFNEINSKLLNVVDQHLISALNEWEVKPTTGPSPTFQRIVRDIGKFYNGYTSIMPPSQTAEMLLRVHANFKRYLKEHLVARRISPHDSLTYGAVSQDFAYYVENMRAFPGCEQFPEDTLSDVSNA